MVRGSFLILLAELDELRDDVRFKLDVPRTQRIAELEEKLRRSKIAQGALIEALEEKDKEEIPLPAISVVVR